MEFLIIWFTFRGNQAIKCLKHFCTYQDSTGIQVNCSLLIDSTDSTKSLLCLFMQEVLYIAVFVIEEYAMIFAGFDWLFDRNDRNTTELGINLKRIEQ